MLYQFNDYATRAIKEIEVSERQREAAKMRLLHQADIFERDEFTCALCKILSTLGVWLVMLGTRLEKLEPVRTA